MRPISPLAIGIITFVILVIVALIYIVFQITTPPGGGAGSGNEWSWTPIVLTIAGLITLVVIGYGIKGHWSAGNPQASMKVVSAGAGAAIILVMIAVILGPSVLVRGFSDTRQMGDNFANRALGQNESTSARGSLCGADEFIQKQVASTTTPTRFTLRPKCHVDWVRSVGVGFRIRFNGAGEYEPWHSAAGAQAPKVHTPNYADVLLASPGPATALAVFFPRR